MKPGPMGINHSILTGAIDNNSNGQPTMLDNPIGTYSYASANSTARFYSAAPDRPQNAAETAGTLPGDIN